MARFKDQKNNQVISSGNHGRRILLRWLIVVSIFVSMLCVVFLWLWRTLPQIAIAEISKLTNAKIDVGLVDFNLDGSVFIKEFVIRPYREKEYDDTILKAKTVYGRFSIGSLLLFDPRLKEIHVKDFIFDAQFDLDTGHWNIGEFNINVPKGDFGKMPLVILEKGILQYSKVSKGQVEVAAEIPIEARFGFDEEKQEGYSFEITTAEMAVGDAKSKLSGFLRPGMITVAGGISSRDIPSFERTWTIDTLAGELTYDTEENYSLRLKIKDLKSIRSPEADTFRLIRPVFLKKSNPFTALQKFFDRYRPSGVVDIELEAIGNFEQLVKSKLMGKVYCKDVSISYRKFPYLIEELKGQIDFTEKSVLFNKLLGKHSNVNVVFDGQSRGFGLDWKYHIRISSDNMNLDNELYDALSAKQKKLWEAFNPRGLASVNYQLIRHSSTDKTKTLLVQLLDAEAEYRHFPYPLKNLSGELLFNRENIIISDVVSKVERQKIAINGKVSGRNTERPIYYVSISANNVPLDSALEESLPEGQRSLYKQFEIRGRADADIKIFTPVEDVGPTSFLADVTLKDSTLKIQKTKKTISVISAKALISPGSISIKNFSGRYIENSFSLGGGIWISEQGQLSRYHLRMGAKKAKLDENLISLLPAPFDKSVSKFNPEGEVDIRVDLNKFSEVDKPDYQIAVNCLGDKINFERFAYPLKNVTGNLVIRNDGITFRNVKAHPDDGVGVIDNNTIIRINGQVTLVERSFKECSFELSAQDISFSEGLGFALPEGMSVFYKILLPVGRFDIDLESIKISNAEDASRVIDFNGSVRFKDCNFVMSGARTGMDGVLKTKGEYKIDSGFSEGKVNIIADSFWIKGKSVTNLNVDINYDPSHKNWVSEKLIADFYGGRLIGDLELNSRSQQGIEYELEVGFDNVDLQRFLSQAKPEQIVEKSYTKGTMSGTLSARAGIGDKSLGVGRCRFIITDMEVGKVSPLARLLQALSMTEPKDFTFERMFVDSFIKRKKLFIETFDMSGETIAFNGSGWMDLPTENINLVLTARGQRLVATEPSVLESLTEGLGGAVVRMKVSGNAYDPKVETKAFPVIGDSLQLLGTKEKKRK